MQTVEGDDSSIKSKENNMEIPDEEKHTPKDTHNVDSLVVWDGPNDSHNPQNWRLAKKLYVTLVVASCTFVVTFGSSVLSSATVILSQDYGVSPTVIGLTIALYVLGFAAGPLAWAPLSEVIGRIRPFLIGFVGFMCFTIGVATAQNLYTIMICRFMQGAWGVATVTVVPGMLVDMWSAGPRTVAMMSWAVTIILGPGIAPVIGSFTVKNDSLGWRWTMWLTLIISSPFLVLSLFIPESWGPLLLKRKAAKVRYETNNWSLHAKLDESPVEIQHLIRTYGVKPMQMLFQEPILAAVTAYNAFIYAVMYLTFEAYPYAFGTVRGWESGVSSLPFLSLAVGFDLGFAAFYTIGRLTSNRAKAQGRPREPEDQLPPMIIGSFLFIIGLFWFAWTSFPSITWVPQVLAGGFIGAGIFLLFTACQTYLLECYLANANSALAANTIARSALAAGFPLFATQMYTNLGVPWATSLLGFLAIALTPFPILFYLYGKKIRSWSKFAY
ncbi:hypothetical protein M409DRAFT_30553 [Zasmidium cellare ATCC 36951]|uniref:Cercosporin MFS transporter CTB4 n=1 Tax=Zasmidium cellare ATCC 36951 TaxID=1080233 RepID=A0A6A6BY73_ZASCE|nr:uncharacterized protein M409DRAFT_30553 [Zasmidium cellare ATCC 36951]KAF2159018.1 hypothetical protein M409DRAFT_30553 [Zasmidium cellare ATCC 36951]